MSSLVTLLSALPRPCHGGVKGQVAPELHGFRVDPELLNVAINGQGNVTLPGANGRASPRPPSSGGIAPMVIPRATQRVRSLLVVLPEEPQYRLHETEGVGGRAVALSVKSNRMSREGIIPWTVAKESLTMTPKHGKATLFGQDNQDRPSAARSASRPRAKRAACPAPHKNGL